MNIQFHADFTLPFFVIPLVLTVILWISVELMLRSRPDKVGFGIGHILDVYIYGALGVVTSLLIWIGYFAWIAMMR